MVVSVHATCLLVADGWRTIIRASRAHRKCQRLAREGTSANRLSDFLCGTDLSGTSRGGGVQRPDGEVQDGRETHPSQIGKEQHCGKLRMLVEKDRRGEDRQPQNDDF